MCLLAGVEGAFLSSFPVVVCTHKGSLKKMVSVSGLLVKDQDRPHPQLV